jgi:hypothetical protein
VPISNERLTPSVVGRPRCAAHRVRRLAALLGFTVTLGTTPVRAVEPTAAAPEPPASPPVSESAGYSLPLGLAYAGAPFLALALGGAMSRLTTDDNVSVLVGSLPFALPAIVHFAHGETKRGIFALPALAGATLLGVALGGFSGALLHPLTCGRNAGTETCEDTLPTSVIAGAVVGGVLGYATYATIDLTLNATPSAPTRKHDVASVQLWMQPLQVPAWTAAGVGRSAAPAGERRLAGALFGAIVQL